MALGLPRGWCWTRRREIRRLADRLCRALAAALGVDGAAMSALTHTPLRQRLGSSDELADLIETVQFSVGEGPCVQAAATGNPVIVEDLHAQAGARWPGFAELAARRLAAVGAVFGFALALDGATLGSVGLFSTSRGPPRAASGNGGFMARAS